jgi:hypothetical protein
MRFHSRAWAERWRRTWQGIRLRVRSGYGTPAAKSSPRHEDALCLLVGVRINWFAATWGELLFSGMLVAGAALLFLMPFLVKNELQLSDG